MKYLFLYLLFIVCTTSAQDVKEKYEWEVKYKASPGKVLGIWPMAQVWNDTVALKELKNKYGFNYIIIYPDLPSYIPAKKIFGTNMMLAFYAGWHDSTNSYNGLWGYYIDEPIRGNIDSLYLKEISQWVHHQNKKSLFLSGDYKRTDYLKQISDNYTDGILFTSYSNWYKLLFWWVPGSVDQRDSWRDMKSIFKDKFYMTWVNAYSDSTEYNNLFSEAKTLKLSGIWLYNAESDVNKRTLSLFCEALVSNGYMEKEYGWVKKTLSGGKLIDVDYNIK